MKRLWSLHNINKPMFAVAYGKTLDDAIIRTCEEINEHDRGERTYPEEWDGEEFNFDTYNGVLIFE